MAKKLSLDAVYESYNQLDLKDKTDLFQKIQKDLYEKSQAAAEEMDLVNSVLNLKKG